MMWWRSRWVFGVLAALGALLVATSGASRVAALIAGLGFTLVLFFWWLFRELSLHAHVTRLLAVGDLPAVRTIAVAEVAGRRGKRQAPFLAYLASAEALAGDWQAAGRAVAQLEAVRPVPRSAAALIGAQVGVDVQVARGDAAAARALFTRAVAPFVLAAGPAGVVVRDECLARLAHADGAWADAHARHIALANDLRLGASSRAVALGFASKASTELGEAARAVDELARARAIGPSTWVAHETPAA